MSKSNDTSNLVTFGDHNTLADIELDVVTGGMLYLGAGSPKQATDAELTKAIYLIAGTILGLG